MHNDSLKTSRPNKWPKIFPPLSPEQEQTNREFMENWLEILSTSSRYSLIENFNHNYVIKNTAKDFLHTLEIGAGLGAHLAYENLTTEQTKNYVALELREDLAGKIQQKFPNIQISIGDCQKHLSFPDGYFERIIAIHVLEHLPNLPATIKEMYRICNKQKGKFLVVIPCESGWLYSLARKFSTQRMFEKRYKQPYINFIGREHINMPKEILEELHPYFHIQSQQFFPFFLPSINLNLCIGLNLHPREKILETFGT